MKRSNANVRILYKSKYMKYILALFLLLFTFIPLNAQTTAAVVAPEIVTAEESDLRKQAFDKVWNTVNERHYDPKFGGVDWAGMRTLYAPQAEAAKTRDDFHNVLRKMLAELKLSHFGILPRNADIQAARKTSGATGIEIKILDGQPVISRVEAGSSAATSGIKPGFTVRTIDGMLAIDALKKIEESFAGRKLTPGIQNVMRERTVQSLINGKADTTLKLEVIDEKDGARSFDIARRTFSGEMSQPLGNFPAQEVIFESKRLPSGIGGMAPGFAGMLLNEKTSLGSMNMREGEQKFVVYPQDNPFLGKVVILEDYGSASTSEIFISGLQEIGRAKIVGETSAGAVLPSVMDTLPTGVTFQYAVSDYRSPKNVLVEGRGVPPDVEVKQTRQALLNGKDLPLEAAEKIILN